MAKLHLPYWVAQTDENMNTDDKDTIERAMLILMNDMFGIELMVPLLRPFRAESNRDPLSQGVALGWIIVPLQGMERRKASSPKNELAWVVSALRNRMANWYGLFAPFELAERTGMKRLLPWNWLSRRVGSRTSSTLLRP